MGKLEPGRRKPFARGQLLNNMDTNGTGLLVPNSQSRMLFVAASCTEYDFHASSYPCPYRAEFEQNCVEGNCCCPAGLLGLVLA